MSNGNNNIKIFDGLVSKTKAYLVVIAILLIILCFYEYKLILPSIFIYFLILILYCLPLQNGDILYVVTHKNYNMKDDRELCIS